MQVKARLMKMGAAILPSSFEIIQFLDIVDEEDEETKFDAIAAVFGMKDPTISNLKLRRFLSLHKLTKRHLVRMGLARTTGKGGKIVPVDII